MKHDKFYFACKTESKAFFWFYTSNMIRSNE